MARSIAGVGVRAIAAYTSTSRRSASSSQCANREPAALAEACTSVALRTGEPPGPRSPLQLDLELPLIALDLEFDLELDLVRDVDRHRHPALVELDVVALGEHGCEP